MDDKKRHIFGFGIESKDVENESNKRIPGADIKS